MKKVAILFGINDYHDCPLKNAVNDASALSDKLSDLGFETKCLTNIDSATMERELREFKNSLDQSSVGLFFFAGHGIQCRGENYLATITSSFADESSCKYTSVPLNFVIEIFDESKVDTKIIILDACRDNPFITWRGSANEGLAPVFAPKGTIIAFSTSPGQKASDGPNNYGIYTNALLTHIGTKNITIEDMFKRVRNTVSSHTEHKQITWEHTSLMGTFCFNSSYDEVGVMTIYSENALADQGYICEDGDVIQSLIDSLKTYNWYKQNPAISKLNKINLLNSDKDDLFVLGRNIYQTACGGSGNAISWIEDIENNLNRIGGNAAIHLLNGVLYEIYFDSRGLIRQDLKADYYEYPVRLCLKESYMPCALFMKKALEQYSQRVIYIPGSPDLFTVDVLINQGEGDYHIAGICVDGLSCMYNRDKTALYEFSYSNSSIDGVNLSQLEQIIKEKMAVLSNRVKFTYNVIVPLETEIFVPHYFNLLRYI